MPINPNNKDQIKRVYKYVEELTGDVYNSTEYHNEWAKYERRISAYYCRPASNQPAYNSKLHLATFWLGVKTFDAQLKRAHRANPMVWVKASDNSIIDQEAETMAAVAHADLNYDLHKSQWRTKLERMEWYFGLIGTCVGREYMKTSINNNIVPFRAKDPYGNDIGYQQDTLTTKEQFTCTDIIHPLNFAHDITKPDFRSSGWGSVRFKLPVVRLYSLLGDKSYNKDGIKEIVERVNKGDYTGYSKSHDEFYTERGAQSTNMLKNDIIINEYFGHLRIKGNENDTQKYHVLFCKEWNIVLKVAKMPFQEIPYWKIRAHPDPDGMYGTGPSDMLLPLNYWENSTVNRFNDYINAVLKMLYKVRPEIIDGGLGTIINGLPYGMVPIIEGEDNNESALNMRSALESIQHNMGGVPLGDTIQLIEKYKERFGAQSTMKGEGSPQLNTATGMMEVAQREDEMTAAIMDNEDRGITDCMMIKLQNRHNTITDMQELQIEVDNQKQYAQYYPYELKGKDYTFEIDRSQPDVKSAEANNLFKFLGVLGNVVPVPPEAIIKAAEKVGRTLNIDGIDEIMAMIKERPPEIGEGEGGQGVQQSPQQAQGQLSGQDALKRMGRMNVQATA